MEMSIPLWLFQGVPESLAVTSLALVLSGQALKFRSVMLVGLPQAVSAFLVRLLPVSFGIHTIILLFLLSIWMTLILKVRLSRSLPAALITVIFLGAAEVGVLSVVLPLWGVTFEQIMENDFLLIVAGLPQIILLFALALGIEWWKTKRHKKSGEYHA